MAVNDENLIGSVSPFTYDFFLSVMKLPYLLLGLTLMAVSACSRQPYSESDVQKYIVPGVTREAVIERFGQPDFFARGAALPEDNAEVDEILYFDLPPAPPGTREDYVFSGFQVWFKQGKVLECHIAHRSNVTDGEETSPEK